MNRGACRVTDLHLCPMFNVVVPHIGGAAFGAAPVKMIAEGLPAVRLGDFANCLTGPPDVLFQGASTVLVGGLPWVGRFHQTVHGGVMLMAASTVYIGDPTFSLPPQMKVKGPAAFQNQVIRDLFLLSTTPTGKALLTRLGAADQSITIVPESDPHNSFAAPVDESRARAGKPTGSTVMYNPDVAITGFDAAGGGITMPPQAVLGHELVHALNNSEGTHHYATDPTPPASQTNIEEEEASAIGTGSHSSDPVTENGFRRDLGLDRRDNHYGANASAPTGSMRPGGY